MKWLTLLGVLILCGGAAPMRIVSINPCLDVDILALADLDHIVALSHYIRDPSQSSVPRTIGDNFPITHETAEEIILLKPDLVLATRHTAPATRQVMTRLGIDYALFDVPDSIEANFAQIRKLGDLIGHPERAEALIAEVTAALDAAAPPPGSPRISALIFQPNGFSIGSDTQADEIMRRTGFDNVAKRYTSRKADNIPLELVIADPPAVMMSGARDNDWSWGARLLRHPALRRLKDTIRQVDMPERLFTCGGPVLEETAGALARARSGE